MTMEQKFNALAAYVLAEDPVEKETAKKALAAAMKTTSGIVLMQDDEAVVHEYLMEIGADPSLMGYKYVVYGIMQAALNPNFIDNLTYGFYPMIAVQFDTTASRAERSIRHVIETLWERGDPEKLIEYFGYSVSSKTGKPTNGHFIARSVIIVKSRLKH